MHGGGDVYVSYKLMLVMENCRLSRHDDWYLLRHLPVLML